MQSGGGKAVLMTATALLLLGLLLPSGAAQTSGEVQWESIGPAGVSILTLVPHPTDPLTLYAVVDAHGVYKSTDGGETWKAKNRGIERLTVLSLAIADESGRVLYAGTINGGVFKSTDSGETWESGNSTVQSRLEGSKVASELPFVQSLAVVNDRMVYAGAGDEGIYKSEDGGESWHPLNEGLPLGLDVRAILLDPWHESVLYVGTGRGIYKSEDGGESWQRKSPFLANALALAGDRKTLYAGSDEGLLRSEDTGEHWDVVRQARLDGLLEVRTLLVDGTSLYLGVSGGIYETLDGQHWESKNGNLPMIDGLVVRGIAKRGERLYIGTGWGIFRSENNGASWVQLSHGLPEKGLIVKGITFGTGGENSLYINTWGGGIYKSMDRGATWSEANRGLGTPYVPVLTTSGRMLYTATWRAIYVSGDAGETWRFSTDLASGARLAVPRPPGSEMYALIRVWEKDLGDEWKSMGRIIKSRDSGSNWQAVESLNMYDITDVLVNPENGQIVYIATRENGIYQSADGGRQWSEFNQGGRIGNIQILAAGGKAGDILFAGAAIGIYRREQDGIWERTILGSYDTIVTDPAHPNRVYAANSDGALIVSEDYGKTWKTAGFADVGINDLAIDPRNSDFIYAATEGQSVLRGDVRELFPGRRNLTPLVIGLSGGLGIVLAATFLSLSRSSGLPPGVLLRQGWALVQVGLQYRDYRRRWETGTPLEQLIVLLTPAKERLDIKQLGQKLTGLHVPPDTDQLDAALNTAVRNGLLLRQEGGYRAAEPALHRALRDNERITGIASLAAQVRDEHPLFVAALRFFPAAGFELAPVPKDPWAFTCRPTLDLWQRRFLTPIYVRLIPDRQLDRIDVHRAVEAAGLEAKAIFTVINQTPDDSAWIEIGACRAAGIQVIPLPDILLREAREVGKEQKRLEHHLGRFIGRKRDLYKARHPVADQLSFFGRDVLAKELLERLAAGEALAILGLRKMGKSSLLHYLRNQTSFPVALVDLQAGTDLPDLYRRALRSWQLSLRVLLPKLMWKPPISGDDPTASFVEATQNLLDELGAHMDAPRLGLFMDEIDLILPQRGQEADDYLTFMRALRGLVQETGQLSLLVAGMDTSFNRLARIRGEQNPAYQFFDEIFLPPLSPADCGQMVRNIGRQMGLVYNDEAIDLVVRHSGGHPFLARQLCSLAYRAQGREPGEIPLSALQEAAARFIREPSTAANLNENGMWGEITNPDLWPAPVIAANEEVLLALADREPLLPAELPPAVDDPAARDTALSELRQRSVLRQVQAAIQITFAAFRGWIRLHKLGLE